MLEIGLGNTYIRVGSITLFMGLMLLYQIRKKSPEHKSFPYECNISVNSQSKDMRQSEKSNESDEPDSSSSESEPYFIKIEVTKNKTSKKSNESCFCERNENMNHHQLNHKKTHVGGDIENCSKKPSLNSNINKIKKVLNNEKIGKPKLIENKKVNKNKISPLIKEKTKYSTKTNKETLNTYNGDRVLHKHPIFIYSTGCGELSNNNSRRLASGTNKSYKTPDPKYLRPNNDYSPGVHHL